MKVALLTPVYSPMTDITSYIWETIKEITISKRYTTKFEAIKNKPQDYICKDDGWHNV